jgi:hypothetical protein
VDKTYLNVKFPDGTGTAGPNYPATQGETVTFSPNVPDNTMPALLHSWTVDGNPGAEWTRPGTEFWSYPLNTASLTAGGHSDAARIQDLNSLVKNGQYQGFTPGRFTWNFTVAAACGDQDEPYEYYTYVDSLDALHAAGG